MVLLRILSSCISAILDYLVEVTACSLNGFWPCQELAMLSSTSSSGCDRMVPLCRFLCLVRFDYYRSFIDPFSYSCLVLLAYFFSQGSESIPSNTESPVAAAGGARHIKIMVRCLLPLPGCIPFSSVFVPKFLARSESPGLIALDRNIVWELPHPQIPVSILDDDSTIFSPPTISPPLFCFLVHLFSILYPL